MIEQWSDDGTATPNSYLYCGEQWDADLGMYFLRARYLNPNSGRFWTMDTFEGFQNEPLSLHKYLYAHADPVNNLDPSGHMNLTELMTTMKQMAILAARVGKPVVKAIEKAYVPFVWALVVGNLALAMTDESLDQHAYPAIPYNMGLLRQFKKNVKKTGYKFHKKIKNLAEYITRGAVAVATAKVSDGHTMKPNGFPDFKNPIFNTFIKFSMTSKWRKTDYRHAEKRYLPNKRKSGETWHHHEVVGIMQLVPTKDHRAAGGHRGGVLIWEILTGERRK